MYKPVDRKMPGRGRGRGRGRGKWTQSGIPAQHQPLSPSLQRSAVIPDPKPGQFDDYVAEEGSGKYLYFLVHGVMYS